MLLSIFTLAILSYAFLLLTKQASISVWTISYALTALLINKFTEPGFLAQSLLTLGFMAFLLSSIKPLRRKFISQKIMTKIAKSMPAMSATEREALEAGTVSWEGNLFSGAPDFDILLKTPKVEFSKEEQDFINGPLDEACRMINDWEITHVHTDLPENLWEFLKKNRFFGMIIPKKFGGLGFSASAQVAILSRLYGRSITVGTTVGVPNSLGPAELLLKYGTKQQKDYYLPRLADGREIPCFALTGPNAGSDAASIPDKGIVCRKEINGESILGLQLTWDKRYITLCPVATVIGLAFRLFDPDNLLGKGVDVGITCALIPASTPGVIKGRRHFPLNTGFLNGPTQGKDVFVPLDYIIGGAEMAGSGWRMLMECLSAGRAISLPSSAAGGAQAGALASGAYARIRKQFNQSIAHFEGIEAPLARIAGNTYLIDAGVTMAAAAIDQGAKPSVAGAILKYHTTERARAIALDAMDIHGGKGICLGPNNYLGRGYQNAPIAITVEGANILTRNLIIFGQGAIRCHPYVFQEMESVRDQNLAQFDTAFWGHAGFILANLSKSLLFIITDGQFTKAPSSKVKPYYQLVHRYSSNMAFLADYSMLIMGGGLKRKEMISARLGDVLSNLYLISAVLKRFHEDGEPNADLPIVEWCCQQLLYETEFAITGIISNFPGAFSKFILKLVLQPFGKKRLQPSDRLCKEVAALLSEPNESRNRITRFVFKEPIENCPLGRLEDAFQKICSIQDLEKELQRAVKKGQLQSLTLLEQIDEAEKAGILAKSQAKTIREAEIARQAIIAVDDFADEALRRSEFEALFSVERAKKKHDDFATEVL